MSPGTEQVSIYLRYLFSGGVTKETFIGYSLRPSKTGTALVHYFFFSLAGPRDKQVVFAIRAKLGLTPQMDVRPYALLYFTLVGVVSSDVSRSSCTTSFTPCCSIFSQSYVFFQVCPCPLLDVLHPAAPPFSLSRHHSENACLLDYTYCFCMNILRKPFFF